MYDINGPGGPLRVDTDGPTLSYLMIYVIYGVYRDTGGPFLILLYPAASMPKRTVPNYTCVRVHTDENFGSSPLIRRSPPRTICDRVGPSVWTHDGPGGIVCVHTRTVPWTVYVYTDGPPGPFLARTEFCMTCLTSA